MEKVEYYKELRFGYPTPNFNNYQPMSILFHLYSSHSNPLHYFVAGLAGTLSAPDVQSVISPKSFGFF